MRQLYDFLNVTGLMVRIFQELTVNKISLQEDKNSIICKQGASHEEGAQEMLTYIKTDICQPYCDKFMAQ